MNISFKNCNLPIRFKGVDNPPKKPSSTSDLLSKSLNESRQNLYCNPVAPAVGVGLTLLGIAYLACKRKLSGPAKKLKPNTNNVRRDFPNPLLKFPELNKWMDEVKIISSRCSAKIDAAAKEWDEAFNAGRIQIERNSCGHFDLLDIQFFKDEFRVHTAIPAEKLKMIKESTNPEMRDLFNSSRSQFWVLDGMMVHGTNRPEKQELVNYFINEAKKHDFDIIHVKAGDVGLKEFDREILEVFTKAKEKFVQEQKHTMIVMDGPVDKLIPHFSIGPGSGPINNLTHKCGENGVFWLSTADDITKLDDSSIRGGRITYKINIDKAIEAGKKAIEAVT